MKKLKTIVALMSCALLSLNTFVAQELPQPSPNAEIKQRIGLTDVTIVYSRPSVKGREIFGKLVPYGEIWRTGANTNTLISFSDDVKINGNSVKAGTYSFFTFPGKTEWKVVLNSVTDGWGDGKYDEKNNVLTTTVKSGKGIMQESMRFTFEKLQPTHGSLVLAWAEVYIELKIDVDVAKKALENIEKAMAEATEKNKAGVYRNAAKYYLDNKIDLEKSLTWINESIAAQEYWYTYWVKADIQHAKGDNAGAIASAKKAIELGEAGAKESGKPFGYKEKIEASITTYK
ncbi:MAG: hypothetical protein CVT95_01065 [Bacteroidetes bacterium HGW-Bacteroidetes-12]|nr:MAG: hypothetical protein CVT95_01065 [Bacteroidetes bacterium HGW-Bacteroidetes-12]